MPDNEILLNGKNGNIIQSDKPTEYAETIEKIYKHPHVYEEMSKFSIVTAKKFGIEKYVERLIELYQII